ncbi:MAG: TetR/AcrR family transcriptional regulator [Yoonia sp.]|nr:TetR/AcrR family transcriptional regulator [Yoonia sp.]
MARHKKVSDQDALLAAINLFWQNGYHNVGTREIEAQTGITRFTLQTSYGGKKALFLKALDTYLDLTDQHLLTPLATADLETLARWFDSPTIPQGFEGSVQSGCFMVNTITALGGQDADVPPRTARYYDMLYAAFGSAIHGAAKAGDLRMVVDLHQCTALAVASAVSLQVAMAAGGPHADHLRTAAAQMIRSWAA